MNQFNSILAASEYLSRRNGATRRQRRRLTCVLVPLFLAIALWLALQ